MRLFASSKFSSKFFPLTMVRLERFILGGHATFIRREFLLLLMFALVDMRRERGINYVGVVGISLTNRTRDRGHRYDDVCRGRSCTRKLCHIHNRVEDRKGVALAQNSAVAKRCTNDG